MQTYRHSNADDYGSRYSEDVNAARYRLQDDGIDSFSRTEQRVKYELVLLFIINM